VCLVYLKARAKVNSRIYKGSILDGVCVKEKRQKSEEIPKEHDSS
jgi:hypothetical protein